MAAEMMSGDLPVTSDADAMAKQKAREDALAGGGTMLASGSTKRKADQVCMSWEYEPRGGGGGRGRRAEPGGGWTGGGRAALLHASPFFIRPVSFPWGPDWTGCFFCFFFTPPDKPATINRNETAQ